MNESNISDLLKLYEEGKATEQQRQLVEAYLAWYQGQSPKREEDEKDEKDPLQEIMNKIDLAREQEAGGEWAREPREAPVYPMGGAVAEPIDGGARRRRYVWAAAAGIILVIGAGLLWKKTTRGPVEAPLAITYKTLQAAPGKTIHLLLSDSSEVWLNAGAILRYPQPFDDKMRKLELLDGEAFFQVHPDVNRGFEVQTEHMVTRVLGTSFDIKAYHESQQMSVTVSSGKVAVAGVTLTANQQARYNTGTGRLSRGTIAADKAQDWKNGTFNFMEESLGDIAIELEHYYNVHIGFKYPGLKKYIFSASFRHSIPLKDMLTTLCSLNQNHLIQIDAQHYVIR